MARVNAPAAALLAAAAALPAAADEPFAQGAEDWAFRVTPYLWAPALDVTAQVGRTVSVSGSTDVLEVLESAVLVAAEARRGDVAVLGEFNYLNLGADASGDARRVRAEVDVDGVMASLTGAYALHREGGTRLDALAGARLWSLETSVDLDSLPAAARRKTWVDPLFGLRGALPLGETVTAEALADIGGFGVGSDLQWEALARVSWRFADGFAAAAGYRHLDVRFDDAPVELDLVLTGPFLGLDVTF